MFCEHCGSKISDNSSFCENCGAPVTVSSNNNQSYSSQNYNYVKANQNAKSKVLTGILAIFFGSLGVHNFYLGYTGRGIAQLLLTVLGWIFLIGPLIASIWAFVEGVLYLVSNDKKDANGNLLV